MNTDDQDRSLGDAATFADSSKRRSADASLGDERTLGGGDAAGIDTVFDDIEVIDLAARYKTEGTLGRGGMGEVLLVLDTRLDRKVAIKRILGEAARSKTAVSRFLTEAKAIAALNHPNVVQIYDYGRTSDGPFLIMEYVDGSSLLDRCRDGALPLEQAVDLACQLCDGLSKAHELGIVHRDIKPANVLLTKDGLPKLTDFGLAKAEAADHQMTMTGAVLGTPDFMPPEQRKDAALVDHRSDLWSLAATLYQMVTGRSPKIIRFDLLPAGLTSVLGKALEESKDDRYQSAREFRDALKTSLVASAPAAAELGEGQCPACGVKNDSSRRFCRGCGESLEASCLSCSKPMPMWEEICGQCGTKQAPLLENRRGEMAARQAEAEGLLKDYDFDEAERLTVSLREESDPRLKQLVPWATDFVGKIGKARDAQLAQAGERLSEALKHEASFDYPSAIHALEQVPDILRNRPLVGHTDTVAAALLRVTSQQSDVDTLESLIKARITSRKLSGLLPDVERLRALRPDRADVEKLCAQLAEREQKLAAHRDEAVAVAQQHLDAKDYESALAVLRKVDRSVETPEVKKLRDAAELSIRSLQNFLGEISQAVAYKQFDGLMTKVQTALGLKPGHAELAKLLESLQARESKVAASIQEVLNQADTAFKACQFAKAAALLQRVPEDRRNLEVSDLFDRCEYLAMTRAAVIAGFEELSKISDLPMAEGVNLKALAVQGRSYLGQIATHGLSEPLIEQWCGKCETAYEKREATAEETRRAAAKLRRVFVGVGAAVAAVLLAAVGLWARSSWRAATIETALARSDWQAALTLDPDNIAAILGQAKEKLSGNPADIDGAFAAIDRAEKLAPGRKDINLARAAAWLKRAVDAAAADRIDDATKAIDEANRYSNDKRELEAARQSIANAWLERAVNAAAAHRIDEATKSLDKANRYTNDERELQVARQAIANGLLKRAVDAAADDRIDDATTALDQAKRYTNDVRELEAGRQSIANVWLKRAVNAAAADRMDDAKKALDEAKRYTNDERELQAASQSIANAWLQQGRIAVERSDAAATAAAVKEATAAGAAAEATAPLRAHAMMLEAFSMVNRDKVTEAATRAIEASLIELSVTKRVLEAQANTALTQAVGRQFRAQFDAALSDRNWDSALKTAAAAEAVDAESSEWLETAILSHPAGLSTIPAEVFTLLPPAVLTSLPPLENSIGIQLKLLPAGKFTMGQSLVDSRKAALTKPFYIGVYEVTNAQWARVMGEVPSKWKDADRPVEQVSWDDANEFCRRLSARAEENRAGRVYRLPTEAEWEYACRAGSTTEYCFGDDESRLDDFGWFGDWEGGGTHPVGQKRANAWGLYDMHGNVSEWCNDYVGDYRKDEVTDPQGPSEGSSRVIRGGSWSRPAEECPSAQRFGLEPSGRPDVFMGFRVAMTSPGAKGDPPKEAIDID